MCLCGLYMIRCVMSCDSCCSGRRIVCIVFGLCVCVVACDALCVVVRCVCLLFAGVVLFVRVCVCG